MSRRKSAREPALRRAEPRRRRTRATNPAGPSGIPESLLGQLSPRPASSAAVEGAGGVDSGDNPAVVRRYFACSTCNPPTRQRKPQDRPDPDRLRGKGKLPFVLSSAGKRLLRGNRQHRPPLEEGERCPLGKVLPDGRRKARSTPALALRCRRRPARFRRLDRPRSPSAP